MKNVITIGLLFLLVLNSVGIKKEYESYSPLTSATEGQYDWSEEALTHSSNNKQASTQGLEIDDVLVVTDEKLASTTSENVEPPAEQPSTEEGETTQKENAGKTTTPLDRAFVDEDGKFYIKKVPHAEGAISIGDSVEKVKSVFGEPTYVEQDELHNLEDMLVYEFTTGEKTVIRINHEGFADFMMVFSNENMIESHFVTHFEGSIYNIPGEYWMYYFLNDTDNSLATYSMENDMYTLKLFHENQVYPDFIQYALETADPVPLDEF